VASDGYTGAQVRDIAIDPINPAVVYAAARSGFFSSTNGGDSWVGLNTPPAFHLEWNAVAVDPSNPKHVLASNNWDPVILQSNNYGQTWNLAGDRLQEGMAWRVFEFSASEPRTVYAGSSAFFSAGVFSDQMAAAGVYVSHDGGNTWNAANDTLSAQANVIDLAAAPDNPQVVYAATGSSGLLRSSNGGNSWTVMQVGVPTSVSVLSVAINPSNTNNVFTGFAHRGLYRSDDDGTTWRQSMAGLAPESRISDIIFDPKHPQLLYAADSLSGVYQSTDSGRSWQQINSALHTRSVNRLVISTDSLHLYAATEGGGVYRLDINGEPPQSVPVQ
jgi:photosystem II stability/assembly factor-like uncharacterized protein